LDGRSACHKASSDIGQQKKQNKQEHAFVSRVGIERTIPVKDLLKTVCSLDHVTNVIPLFDLFIELYSYSKFYIIFFYSLYPA
jgi:hypothetical protein